MRPSKLSRYGTIKIPPCSMTVSTEQSPKLTSLYEGNLFEHNIKQH